MDFVATTGLPPVEVAEHYPETRDILAGLELLPGESRQFAAAWRSITSRYAENVSCQGIAPEPDSNDWLVCWTSSGSRFSYREWRVEFRLTSTRPGRSLYVVEMRIWSSSWDGAGMRLLATLDPQQTPLVEEAFRRRLIADGEYQLICDALDEGREDDVWYGDYDEQPHIDCTPEEALARGLEILHKGGFPTQSTDSQNSAPFTEGTPQTMPRPATSATSDLAVVVEGDSCGWLFQSQYCWDDFLTDCITAAGLEGCRVPLTATREILLRFLAPLAEPYGVVLGEDGEFLIRDGADENAAREVCCRALTTEVLNGAIRNAKTRTEIPLCCVLHEWVPGACSTHTPQENDDEALPPVEVAEHHPEVCDVLAGESRHLADAWDVIAYGHAESVSCQGVAPVPDSDDWLVWWGANGSSASDRRVVVEFRLTPASGMSQQPLRVESMRIHTSGDNGRGRYDLPEIRAGEDGIVNEAFRRRLIADGEYQLALEALDEGREDIVLYGDDDEPYINPHIDGGLKRDEALARGLGLLYTTIPSSPLPAKPADLGTPEPTPEELPIPDWERELLDATGDPAPQEPTN